jgi:hypothetical protein
MNLLRILLLFLPALACAQDRYQAVFDDGLGAIEVTACFDGTPPARLYHSDRAGEYLASFSSASRRLTLRPGETSTRLRGLAPGACLNWRLDLRANSKTGDPRTIMKAGEDLITDADLWFWRGPSERDVLIEIEVPRGMNVSAPWQAAGRRDGKFLFRPAATPATWASRVAIGRFDVQKVKLDGTEARVSITGSLSVETQARLTQWITQAAQAVGSVYGHYPQASPQILVVPTGPRNGPVPWAHVMRGGGVGAEFFVDETRSLEELSSDWTACHELAHMLLPFVSSRDRWLSEGMASYYQYVLLARSGMLSEQEAWQGLHDGFGRGRADSGGGTLREATAEGWKHTMRVYWSGAAIMMMADVHLRTQSQGRQSLDSALAALQSCCMDNTRRWRASELFRQLDRITGTRVFTSLYQQHVNNRRFPDLAGTWDSLGVRSLKNRIHLSDDAEWAGVRTGIMSRSRPGSAVASGH